MFTDPVVLNPVTEVRYFKTVSVAQSARQEICLVLTDSKGHAIDLGARDPVKAEPCEDCDDQPDAENPGFPDGVEPKGLWPDVTIQLIAQAGFGMPKLFQTAGTVTNFAEAKVVFHLTEEYTNAYGIYLAEVGLFRGDRLMQRWPLYLSIEPSLWSSQQHTVTGWITVPEIRLAMRDLDPSFNDLLDDLEFKDAEILACMKMPVDRWNELLPIEPSLQFNYNNFPFRYNWLRATCGYLLELAAHWYRRNELQATAGGITVADRNKHLTYEPKAEQLLAEYDQWSKSQKAARSLWLSFGHVGSNWPGSR